MTTEQFRKIVWAHYKKEGRHDLPWRLPAGRQGKTHDPYRILVSEVMLQQTQVERVKPYYQAWMKQFPTAKALAAAPLASVLKAWQGLGYNSRGKRLWEAAKIIAKQKDKEAFPKTAEALEKLPGIGPYTARAVMAFAHNADVIFIETNIRTAVIHHFFPKPKSTPVQKTKVKPSSQNRNIAMHRYISDEQILEVLEKVHPKGKSREWYAALMDYGAHLKRSGVRLNAKTKGYAKQSTFAGSDRQARGAILRELAKGKATKLRLLGLLGDDRKSQIETQLTKLLAEGMVANRSTYYTLPH